MSLPASSGNTALHFAALNDRKGIVDVLLKSGADPSLPNDQGLIPLELCRTADIRSLLLTDLSHTNQPVRALSQMMMARLNMKASMVGDYAAVHSNTGNAIAESTSTNAINGFDLNYTGNRTDISDKVCLIHGENSENATSLVIVNGGNSQQHASSLEIPLNTAVNVPVTLNDVSDRVDMSMSCVDEQEESQDLHYAVLAAATETTYAMQTLEMSDARYAVVKLCQQCDEKKLRKVSYPCHYFV